jgi:hypothetical protein
MIMILAAKPAAFHQVGIGAQAGQPCPSNSKGKKALHRWPNNMGTESNTNSRVHPVMLMSKSIQHQLNSSDQSCLW